MIVSSIILGIFLMLCLIGIAYVGGTYRDDNPILVLALIAATIGISQIALTVSLAVDNARAIASVEKNE